MDTPKVIDALKTIVRPDEAIGHFTVMDALQYLDQLSKDRETGLNGQFRHFLEPEHDSPLQQRQ